jgi:hypothetical protein
VSAHDDDAGGKPDCAGDDEVARDALVTGLVADALAPHVERQPAAPGAIAIRMTCRHAGASGTGGLRLRDSLSAG